METNIGRVLKKNGGGPEAAANHAGAVLSGTQRAHYPLN